jgi:hypothetical protein
MAEALLFLLLQSPFDIQMPENWFGIVGDILNVLFALAVRGYLIVLLIGLIIFATGFSDGFSKILVGFGIVLFFGGPFIVNLFGQFSGIEPVTLESATAVWLRIFGMTDAELFMILVWLGDAIACIWLLAGAILYLTPSANDLTSRGKSMIVRALMLAPVLAFFHVATWL